MNFRTLALLFIFSRTVGLAQGDLVSYKEIVFNSELEKRVLDDHFLNKKSDLFLLFMASGSLLREDAVAEAKSRFYRQLDGISASVAAVKKNDKKVKQVYDKLHAMFLSKYETRNRFEDIFYNGNYNCVSATALHGLAFHHLNIPYWIKEKPTHVYLLAYPETENIMVETTAPIAGSQVLSQQFKQNYIKVLRDQKIISTNEYASGNINSLFDKYYFNIQGNITLLQLVGLQYLNEGIYKLEEERYPEALNQLEKAYLFYPCDRVGYTLMSSAYETFTRRQEKDTVHANSLAKMARFKRYGITSEMIQSEFMRVIQELLVNRGEKEKLNEYYEQLQQGINEDELRNEIKFIYNYENGRSYYNKARFRESIPFFEECLALKPKQEDASQLLIISVAQSLRNNSNPQIIKVLEGYSAKYPQLLENNNFNEMLGSTYLREIEMNFESGKPVEAEKYRVIFEQFQKQHQEVTYDHRLFGEAYSAGAVYYFKKGQTLKAKSLLASGLAISPNNYELLARKRMID